MVLAIDMPDNLVNLMPYLSMSYKRGQIDKKMENCGTNV